MIRSRRGLTLLETLLASAILAMLAGACVPMLSAATRSIAATDGTSIGDLQRLRFDLGNLADAFMLDPRMFDCTDLPKSIQQGESSINWPAEQVQLAKGVTVRAMSPSSGSKDYLWLVFTCESESVVRYLALPKEASVK
jgi:prepilin-type N-terminal cleavage/methylation domain-containing protein